MRKPEFQFAEVALSRLREQVQLGQGLPKTFLGFDECIMCFGSSTRPRPFNQGTFGFTRLGPVACKNLWLRRLRRRELFTDRLCYQPMQILAAAPEYGLIRGVADQGMLELVGGIRRDSPHIKQFGISQCTESALKLFLCDRV